MPFLAIIGGVFLLIVAQPDLGTAITIGGVAVGMYFLANAPYRDIGIIGVLSATGLAGLIAVAPYRMERLLTFLHPERDPLGDGYHINQALLAIGSGGFWGRGYGHSRAKFQYLPEVSGDSIFAVIGEELGFVFTVALIMLYGYIFLRILRIAERAPDTFGRLLVAGIGIWLFVQMMVNVGAMVALFPLTGLPLPFISYGGTALMTMLTGIGILMSVSRQSAR
jgi:cell division protein FtsW